MLKSSIGYGLGWSQRFHRVPTKFISVNFFKISIYFLYFMFERGKSLRFININMCLCFQQFKRYVHAVIIVISSKSSN